MFPLFLFALINTFNMIECAPGGYGYGGGMSGGGGGFGNMGGGKLKFKMEILITSL